MAIKTYKPTTPSRRHMTVSAFEGIDKKALATLLKESKLKWKDPQDLLALIDYIAANLK